MPFLPNMGLKPPSEEELQGLYNQALEYKAQQQREMSANPKQQGLYNKYIPDIVKEYWEYTSPQDKYYDAIQLAASLATAGFGGLAKSIVPSTTKSTARIGKNALFNIGKKLAEEAGENYIINNVIPEGLARSTANFADTTLDSLNAVKAAKMLKAAGIF